MITESEIVNRFVELGFIVKRSGINYSVRAPTWLECDDDKDIHNTIMGHTVEKNATIDQLLIILVKNGLIEIEGSHHESTNST